MHGRGVLRPPTVYVGVACRSPAGSGSPVKKGETRPSMSWPGLVSPEGDWPPEGGPLILAHGSRLAQEVAVGSRPIARLPSPEPSDRPENRPIARLPGHQPPDQ